MKTRIKFTGYLDYDGETDLAPDDAVDIALERGDKHAEYTLWCEDIESVEEVGDDE